MTSTERCELEIDFLYKRKQAIESDMEFKVQQYNDNEPWEEGMHDPDIAHLMLLELRRDRDRLDVEIAEKKLALYDLQGGSVEPEPTLQATT